MTEQNITIAELSNMDDEDFTNALKAGMWNHGTFAIFLELEVVDRTATLLGALAGSIQGQIEGRDDPDHAWLRRVKGFLRMIRTRHNQAKGVIKDLNREETASVHAAFKKWGGLALELAEALDASGPAGRAELESIAVDGGPGTGESITAAEWLDVRREMNAKRAAKEAAQAAELGLAA